MSSDDIQPDLQEKTLYEIIGGDLKLRELVDRFYDLMMLEAEFQNIRVMHPVDMAGSRDKLYWFLCGWTGGPNYYNEQFGHPRLRARHLSFRIGISERDQWLRCMGLAMQDVGFAEALQLRLIPQ